MAYDSRIDTYEHIQKVQGFMARAVESLMDRSAKHDQSKLLSPEKEVFDEFTPKLAASTYGSEEYKAFLKGMGEGLEHHYRNNTHHPEYFTSGIRGMSLLDVLEMLCDWKAATLRHKNGDLAGSIEMNQKRFGYSDDFKKMLFNTATELRLF